MSNQVLVQDNNYEAICELVSKEEMVSLDTETSIGETMHDKYVLGFSLYAPNSDTAYYFPIRHINSAMGNHNLTVNLDILYLTLRQTHLVFHNAKFDMQIFLKLGMDFTTRQFEDTMLMSYVINEEPPHGLKELADIYVGAGSSDDQAMIKVATKGFTWEKIPMEFMARYATMDTILTWKLFQKLGAHKTMQSEDMRKIYVRDLDFCRVLTAIEQRGVLINPVEARLKSIECTQRMNAIIKELGYDPQKPAQLANRLYGVPPKGLGFQPVALGQPTKSFPNGRPKMGVGELEQHAHPEVGLILEYRRVQKAQSTWYDGWLSLIDEKNRIHATYNQHATVTSRLSCSNPNLQQIPRDSDENVTKAAFPVKRLLQATPGFELVEFDYSQVELRLGSLYAEEEDLIETFRANGDPHQLVADRLGLSRFMAKTFNFLVAFGGGPERLLVTLRKIGVHWTWRQCDDAIQAWHAAYPGFKQVTFQCARTMETKGYIQLWTKRRRRMQYDFHAAFNSLIQGGCAEIMRESMLRLHSHKIQLVGQVHDSVWVEIPTGDMQQIAKIKEIMEWPGEQFKLPFPVDVKILTGAH